MSALKINITPPPVESDHVPLPPSLQTTYRGVKNPEAVERKRKKQEEIEKQAMTPSASGGGGLKVGTGTQ